MSIRAHVVHAMPGRVRVRLPEHRGDTDLFARIEQQLAESELFDSVEANVLTGSLLLEFTGPLEELLEKLAGELPVEFELMPEAPTPALPPADILDPLRLVSGRNMNPMMVAGTLFGAIGVVQAVRGRFLMPALTAFWYATNAFRLAREAPHGEAEVKGH
jgi:hypothetical protein